MTQSGYVECMRGVGKTDKNGVGSREVNRVFGRPKPEWEKIMEKNLKNFCGIGRDSLYKDGSVFVS